MASKCSLVALCAGGDEAKGELASAVLCHDGSYSGVRAAVIQTSGSSVTWGGVIAGSEDCEPELFKLACFSGRAWVFEGNRSDLELAVRQEARSARTEDGEASPKFPSHVFEPVRLSDTACWVIGHLRNDQEGNFSVGVRADGTAKPAREFLLAPPTWQNSNLALKLIDELGMEAYSKNTRPQSLFTATAYSLPVIISLLVAWWLWGFSIATNVACVILGFALNEPWRRYAKGVRRYIELARESGESPWQSLKTTVRFTFGVAVWKTRSGTAIKIRRPRRYLHKVFARRLERLFERRVKPVLGSFPPQWHVYVGRRPLGTLRALAFKVNLWRARRVLLLEARCDREADDVIRRFRRGATLVFSAPRRYGDDTTIRYAASVVAAMTSGGVPPSESSPTQASGDCEH